MPPAAPRRARTASGAGRSWPQRRSRRPQLSSANSLAAAGDLSIESKNDAPASAEIVNWATVFGIALALGVLAMSVGLIRSETASDLRTLTAAGARPHPAQPDGGHRGRLAFLGAVLGTVAAYIGLFGWFRWKSLEGGVSDIIKHVPWSNLFFIVIAMPTRRHPHRLGAGRAASRQASPPARWSESGAAVHSDAASVMQRDSHTEAERWTVQRRRARAAFRRPPRRPGDLPGVAGHRDTDHGGLAHLVVGSAFENWPPCTLYSVDTPWPG